MLGDGSVSDTQRVRLDIAYAGGAFHGWAAQPGLRTVEGMLAEALATITRGTVALTVAGRTDAGVHAAWQVAHVDIASEVWDGLPGRSTRSSGEALADRLNGVLGHMCEADPDVIVRSAAPVADTFDARFSACGRHYRYLAADLRALACPWRLDVAVAKRPLDVAAMGEAARALIGEHDFLPFAKPRPGATTIRHLKQLDVSRTPDGLVAFTLHADAFCHSQVRFMVGALMRVGERARPIGWIGDVLRAGVRDSAVPVAPARGLTLVRVDYPAPENYAAQAERARVVRTLPAR
nr:tRNA pseudouridine(38-40) synthase TruA [Nanchangia anserum]